MITKLTTATAVMLALAGCGGGATDNAKALIDCQGVPVSAMTAHGVPVRDEGTVEVTQENGRFSAKRTVSLENGIGGASAVDVTSLSANGIVVDCAQNSGGYAIGVFLEGRGATEQEARQALDSMTVLHGDNLTGSQLTLDTRVQFADAPAVALPIPIVLADSLERSASIISGLPAAPAYALHQGTANGGIEAGGLNGTLADLFTANGSIGLDGRWDQTRLETSNGNIAVAGDHAALQASAPNGNIAALLATVRSASATLAASNGSVDVQLQRAGAAYDLQGRATNGSVSIDVAGTEAVGEQSETSAHRQSPGYAGAAVQVAVDAQASNGQVRISE